MTLHLRHLLLGAVMLPAIPLSAQQSALPLPGVDSAARQFMDVRRIPGMAVVLLADGRVQEERVYGVRDLRSGAPLQPGTVFQVGSVTKAFTAALIGSLVADRRVDTAAPVGRYLPRVSPALRGIRIADLLRQASGLADAAGGDGDHQARSLVADVSAWGDSLALLPPGTAFSYSNLGYTLLGAIAEQAGRRPYGELLRQRVLEPLGVSPATLGGGFPPGMVRAIGHRPDQSGNLTAVDPPSDDTRLWPAGYLAATPTGVGRLVTALLNEGRVEGRQVLPSGWVRRMTTPQVAVPGMFGGTGYGFGVFIDTLWGGPAIWHPGLIDGSTALFLGLPREHLGVVVLANRDGVRLEGLAREILALLYRSRGGTPTQPPPFTPPTVAEVPGSQFDALTGTYEGRFQIRVLRQADSLLLERFGSRAALHPLAGGQWLVGQATPERRELITIHVAHDKVPTFIQMGLWAFVRRDSTSSGH